MHFWPQFGNTDFNWWWLIARTSSKWGKFWHLSSIWSWSSGSIVPKNQRDLNQGLLHLWSKFGGSSLNGWWVTARTSWWLTDRHTHTHTHTRRQRQYPKAKTGLRQKTIIANSIAYVGYDTWYYADNISPDRLIKNLCKHGLYLFAESNFTLCVHD